MSKEEREAHNKNRPKWQQTEFEGPIEKLIEKYKDLDEVRKHLTLGQSMKYEFTENGQVLDQKGNLIYDGEKLVWINFKPISKGSHVQTRRWTALGKINFLKFFSLLPILVILSCGNQDGGKIPEQKAASPQAKIEEQHASTTLYGTKAEIETYLNRINPHVQEVGRIQLLVDNNIGSSGRATGTNLAPAMQSTKPNLEAILDTLSIVNPPPLLSSFHNNFKKLVTLRIAAYSTIIRGFELEQKTGDLSLYEKAEASLDEANKLIVLLNEEMGKIMESLASISTQQTASPK